MGIKIVPTVLANTKEEFNTRLRKLLPITDEIQVDIMDGRFVPSLSIPINQVPEVSRWENKRFEAHLMVENPGAHIQPMARRGFKRVIFHIEAADERSMPNLIAQSRKYRLEVALAINPETPVNKLLPYVAEIDGVVFLGVHPGFNGAPYVKSTPKRISEFVKKNTNKKLIIQVDGGMSPATMRGVVAAGARRINSGSFVSNASDPAAAVKQLYEAARSPAKPKKRTVEKSKKKSMPSPKSVKQAKKKQVKKQVKRRGGR